LLHYRLPERSILVGPSGRARVIPGVNHSKQVVILGSGVI